MRLSGAMMCHIIALLIALASLIFGLMVMLAKQQPKELTDGQVLARQMRGLAFVILAPCLYVALRWLCSMAGLGEAAKAPAMA